MYRGETQSNVARAIRRSRAARAAIRSRHRRSVAFTAAFLLLASAGTFSLAGLTGDDVVEAAVSQAKGLAELLGQRSPGERTEAQLTKTKHARALAKQRIGTQPKGRADPPGPTEANLVEVAQLLAGPP